MESVTSFNIRILILLDYFNTRLPCAVHLLTDDFSDSVKLPTFEEMQNMVNPEFEVTDSFVEHGIPSFYINYNQQTKEAFLRLVKRLDSLELIPLLRKNQGKVILRIVAKPHVNPSRNIINVGLFFAYSGNIVHFRIFSSRWRHYWCCIIHCFNYVNIGHS